MKYLVTMYFQDFDGFEVSTTAEIDATCNTEAGNLAEVEAKKVHAIYYNVEKI